MTTNKEMKDFWDTCPEEFAHIKIDNQDLVVSVDWDKEFLHKLNDITNLPFKRIADYGCGGGQLGIHLHKKYGIAGYIGLDISIRQVDHANKRLARYLDNAQGPRLFVIISDTMHMRIGNLNADILISQATIQHFPSLEYLIEFLEEVNSSGIDTVVLQFRTDDSGITAIMNDGYEKVRDVCFKCYTNTAFIEQALTNYTLEWEGPFIEAVKGQYIILKRK